MRSRLIVVCLLCLSSGLALAQDSAERVPEPALLDVMRAVLAGEVQEAVQQAQSLNQDYRLPLTQQLLNEVSDLARGNYATTGNRSYPTLLPLWQSARQQWLSRVRPQEIAGLPRSIITLPESVSRILLVDIGQSAAWFALRRDEQWQIADAFYVSVGAAGADKRKRGDRRTPVGVYWAVDELDATKLPARYGTRVFPLDYPNALDRQQRRTGDGIWLHGIDPNNNVRPPRDTDGCVAFGNSRIEMLAAQLELGQTPVVLAESLDWRPQAQRPAIASQLRDALNQWRRSFLAADETTYFAIYADAFSRFGEPAARWRQAERVAMHSGLARSKSIAELEIFLADVDEQIYLTRFRQTLHRKNAPPITTIRRLYWQRIDDNWQIVADQNG
ncbi:MAG: L,D-transpeptidase family protein [Pseudomonadota bacterium]